MPSSAGLPAATGLYTTIACLVGYALFGPSRVLVLGISIEFLSSELHNVLFPTAVDQAAPATRRH